MIDITKLETLLKQALSSEYLWEEQAAAGKFVLVGQELIDLVKAAETYSQPIIEKALDAFESKLKELFK